MKYMFYFLLCISLGCSKPYQSLFVEIVQDHKKISVETLTAVKKTIIDESSSGNLNDDQKKGIQNLLDRIDFIMDGSITIDKYVNTNYTDEEILADLLRNKWSGEKK